MTSKIRFQIKWCSKSELQDWLAFPAGTKYCAKCTACGKQFNMSGKVIIQLRSQACDGQDITAIKTMSRVLFVLSWTLSCFIAIMTKIKVTCQRFYCLTLSLLTALK